MDATCKAVYVYFMTKERPNETLENYKRRLKYMAKYRGSKEMDLIMGSFCDAHIDDFDASELQEFENLMQIPDQDLYNWITKKDDPPTDQSDILKLYLKHQYKSA